MEKYLTLALLLCALPSLTVAFCYQQMIEPGATHCVDEVDNTRHAVGTKWRNSDCMDCSCSGCCSAFSEPRQFPDDCVKVFDRAACKYIVHRRDNPSILCPIYGGVGK